MLHRLEPSHLDGLVTVGTVVNDGERLLESGATDADDISNQLTDSYDHLGERPNKVRAAEINNLQENGQH